jgi:hypothetical protein
MASRKQAVEWLNAQNGKALDFDGVYSLQCVDFFNYYYQFLTGRNPYSDGYGVAGAKDLWGVPTSRFTKVLNNPNDPNQFPSAGDILIYSVGAYGHINVCLSADNNGLTTIGQNENNRNDKVSIVTRNWSTVVGSLKLIGWLSYNLFTTEDLPTNQRIVNPNGVNCRERPNTNSTILKEGVAGEILTFKGFVTGENVSGNDKWFVGAFSGCYAWSGAFTNPLTAGLPDITPATIPAPVEPPKEEAYSFVKDLECVTEVIPAASQNFQKGNFPAKPLKAIIHDFGTRGVDTYTSVVNTIKKNGERVVGAHFVISGKKITQMVSLADRAYHAGPNGNSFVGIETDPNQDPDTINSTKLVLKQLKEKFGYKLELIKHSSVMSTACGDDVDLKNYDITPVVPPVIPEPPIVPEKPVPDTKPPENGSQTLLEAIKLLIDKIIKWLSQWKRSK